MPFLCGSALLTLALSHPDDHTKRRRMMGQLYNRSKMPNLESLMCRHISEFIKTIGSREGPFDVAVACRALEADIICTFTFIWTLTSAVLNNCEAEFSFGKTIGAIRAWDKGHILDTVSKNDQKASLMPLVGCPARRCFDIPQYSLRQLTHYPLLYKFWTLWEYLKCRVQETETTSYLQGLEQFDKVCNSKF